MSSRIILTGVSSFTGFWIAKSLAKAGHLLICPLPRPSDSYKDLKKKRLNALAEDSIQINYNSPYGSDQFMKLLSDGADLICFHGSVVKDYNSRDFSATEAIFANLNGVEKVIASIKATGTTRVIWTSSVFEDAVSLDVPEDDCKPPWYRYAISKKFSGLILQSLCNEKGIGFSRFVITNPFGPFEDPKICNFLARALIEKKPIEIRTPYYVRDMIHIGHLADSYLNLCQNLLSEKKVPELRPSEYSGRLIDFAKLFVQEIGQRLGYNTEISYAKSMVFDEPLSLINSVHVSSIIEPYQPDKEWDSLATFYTESIS